MSESRVAQLSLEMAVDSPVKLYIALCPVEYLAWEDPLILSVAIGHKLDSLYTVLTNCRSGTRGGPLKFVVVLQLHYQQVGDPLKKRN